MPSTPVQPEPAGVESARRQRTRERLIDAAYEVFAEHGVHAASVEMIAERAGFTRGAFYSNFDTKEELFFALAERENRLRFERLRHGVDTILPGLDGRQERIDRDIAEIVTEFLKLQADDRRWCLVQSEFRMLALRDRSVAPTFLAVQRDFQKQLAAQIEEAAGAIGLDFVLEPVTIARVVVAVYEAAMQEFILEDGDDDVALSPFVLETLPALIRSLTKPL